MRENDLGKDKIIPLLLKLALPSMLAQFVNVAYSIVDRIYIANMDVVGDLALAGLGVCAPIISFITSFCFLLGLGGAPLLAMKMGEGKNDEAKKILSNCFMMLLIFSVILTIIFLIFKDKLILLFGGSAETFEYANKYLTVYLFGNVFALLAAGLNNFITCQGFSRISMMTVLLGAVLNIVLDPIFIFTFNMGVTGAALATVIAQATSAIWVLIFLTGKRTFIKLGFSKFDFKICLKIIRLGFTPFLIISTDSLILVLLNSVLQKTGGNAYVVSATIVISFMQIITMPLGGITLGCQPVISYNYGANNLARVKNAFLGVLTLCLIFTTIMQIISLTIPQLFVSIFTDNAIISDISIQGIKIYTSGIILLAIQYATVDSLVGLGVSGTSVFLSLFRKIGIITTLTLILPTFIGWQGAFLAEGIGDLFSGVFSGIIFFFTFKRILKKRRAISTLEKV